MAQFSGKLPASSRPAYVKAAALLLFTLCAVALTPGAAFAQTAGDPPAANAVFQQAKAFHDGTGQAQDLQQAKALYRRAADMGSNYACINLGYMYFTGEGAPQNYSVSRQWYEAAANNGNADAQRMMSVFYENGLGVKADAKTAQLWAGRAADGWQKKPAAPAQKAEIKPPAEAKTKTGATPRTVVQAAPKTAVPEIVDTAKAERMQAALERRANERAAQAAKTAASAKASADLKPKPTPKPVPKPTDTPPESGKSPIWLGLISALALAMFGSLAILSEKFQAVKAVRDNRQFVRAFYARHQGVLKSSYAKAQQHKGVIISDREDPWVSAAVNLMIRFAGKHEIVTGRPMRLTANVIRAQQKSLRAAEDILMPLMPALEDVLLDDLAGLFTGQNEKLKAVDLISDMIKPKPSTDYLTAAQ